MFFQSQYLQDVRGHSAVLSGLMILPVTVPMTFVSPFSGRLIARFGARLLMTLGMVLGTLGLVALTQLGDDGSFADAIAGSTWVLVALCAVGAVLTWAFVRDSERPGPDPAVAGEPSPDQLHHHLHHRKFHL